MQNASRIVTADELAAVARVKPATIKRGARLGTIPALRFGYRTIRFDLDAALAALASNPAPQIRRRRTHAAKTMAA